MKTATPGVDLAPIDRLEEKMRRLVGVVERLKAEQTAVVEDNGRLTREVEALRARLAAGETAAGEVTALREERDLIRSRVGEMLDQLEALDL